MSLIIRQILQSLPAPVERMAAHKLRHWPPGMDPKKFMPSFLAIPGKVRLVTMKHFAGAIALGVIALAASAQWGSAGVGSPQSAQDIPAYNAAAPSRPLPPIMSGNQLSGPSFTHEYQVTAYKMAAKIPAVLHQQPCYCRCDREMGHNSLHSCFEGTHGAACSTCMKEGVFAYQMTKKGKTPTQIRAAIERGEWMNVDLEKAAL